jgi:hypothetical protein
MAKELSSNFEETIHYSGEAIVRFYPGAHYYSVTDNGYIDPITGKPAPFKNRRMGGATSLTGVMSKGQGLMLYPMYEMRKYLKNYFRSTTIEEMFDSPMSLDDLLKEGTQAHVKKSDRGKSVGTDAHAWVESLLIEMIRVQKKLKLTSVDDIVANKKAYDKELKIPEINTVEEIGVILRRSYIELFKAAKPKDIEEYRKLSKLIFADAEIQEKMFVEATMLNKSVTAAKQWFAIHDIFVHGTEDTIYSRELQVCGKYDGDLEVRCSSRCNFCYLNGDEQKIIDTLNEFGQDHTFTGRYIEDFKSTNSSNDAPKGIYPEYMGQCGVYDVGKTEEFPEIKYDGALIVNGSKNDGTFNTHYSFNRERNCSWARHLAVLKEVIYEAGKEIKASA